MSKLLLRIDAGILMPPQALSGVGYYTSRLVEALSETPEIDLELMYGPLYRTRNPESFTKLPRIVQACVRLSYRMYRKLDSYNLAPPCDLLFPSVDATLFPANFSTWRTIRSRLSLVTIHDLTYLYYPDLMESGNLAHLQRVVPRAIKQADVVLTVSESVKAELIKEFAPDPIRCIVTPVPPDASYFIPNNNPVHETYGISTMRYVLFIGNLEPRKNVPSLIEAYCLLPSELRRKHSLVIAGGKGWNTTESESAIEQARSKGESIHTVGYVDHNDISALFQKASVLVWPSLYEGFGMPLLEAMAGKTPVIASDIPVLRETGGNAALYVNPHDPASIQEALQKVLSSQEVRNELIDKGSQRVRMLSWPDNVNLIAESIKDNLTEVDNDTSGIMEDINEHKKEN